MHCTKTKTKKSVGDLRLAEFIWYGRILMLFITKKKRHVENFGIKKIKKMVSDFWCPLFISKILGAVYYPKKNATLRILESRKW